MNIVNIYLTVKVYSLFVNLLNVEFGNCDLRRPGSVVATFQATINLGANVPTSAQQTATDSLVSGVLAGVQSNGLAGYIVIAVNYSVVANFSTATTATSFSSTTTVLYIFLD